MTCLSPTRGPMSPRSPFSCVRVFFVAVRADWLFGTGGSWIPVPFIKKKKKGLKPAPDLANNFQKTSG